MVDDPRKVLSNDEAAVMHATRLWEQAQHSPWVPEYDGPLCRPISRPELVRTIARRLVRREFLVRVPLGQTGWFGYHSTDDGRKALEAWARSDPAGAAALATPEPELVAA